MNDNVCFLDSIGKSEEFTSAYNTLMAARVTVQKARAQYDKCVLQYNAAMTKRKEVTAQVEALKRKLADVSLSMFCLYWFYFSVDYANRVI